MRVGLIGCGRWGRFILRDLLACHADVYVVSPNASANQQALAMGAKSARCDDSELADMDGFVIASPTTTHAAVIERLLPYERPIFVEKPMTADVESARRIAARAGDRVFVMDKWRYHPVIEAMRGEICGGRIGAVLAIRAIRFGWGCPHKDVSALWILAPHDLSIALHLTGSLPHVHRVMPIPGFGAIAQLQGDGGPSITIEFAAASPEHLRRFTVIGTRATLELRGSYDDRMFIREGSPDDLNAPEKSIVCPGKMPLLAEIERFLGFLSGGPPPISSASDGLLIVERLAAIEAALRKGEAS